MTSISSIAGSALRALNAYTAAISVTNNNISNVETDGYSRQTAVLTSTADGGVDMSSVKRIYSAYLTDQLWSAEQDSGKWEAENEVMASLDSLVSVSDSTGISSALSAFWSHWQAVVNDPSDSTDRSTLASAAETLAASISNLYSDISNIRSDVAQSVSGVVSDVNDLTQQMAALNGKISAAAESGADTSSYQDSLDSLVKQLSERVNIDTYTNNQGRLCIQLTRGGSLVEGTTASTLCSDVDSSGQIAITLSGISGDSVDVTDSITSGKIGGYLEVANDVIPEYLDKLDTFASMLISSVNTLHESGYDLNGNTGTSFFTGTGAGDMAVNSNILDDPSKIAASSAADATDDSTVASSIAALENRPVLDSGTSTFSDYYAALVSDIGCKASTVASNETSASATVSSCQTLHDSASSASTDEELTKLMLYQQAYEAAAKMMTALDEMLKTLIDM